MLKTIQPHPIQPHPIQVAIVPVAQAIQVRPAQAAQVVQAVHLAAEAEAEIRLIK